MPELALFKVDCSLKKKYVLLEFLGLYGNITVQVVNYKDLSTIKSVRSETLSIFVFRRTKSC